MQIQSISLKVKLTLQFPQDIDCSDEEFQLRMEARVSEICSKMAQLNQQSLEKTDENDKRKRANPGWDIFRISCFLIKILFKCR